MIFIARTHLGSSPSITVRRNAEKAGAPITNSRAAAALASSSPCAPSLAMSFAISDLCDGEMDTVSR